MRQSFNQQPRFAAMAAPDLFISSARERDSIQQVQDEVKEFISDVYPDTDQLVEKIEASGIPVITKTPEMQLKFSMMLVGVQLGFVAPNIPKYDLFVENLKKYLPEKAHMDFSKGMIIVFKDNYEFSYVTYQFYQWSTYHRGLPGFEPQARKLFEIFARKYNYVMQPKFLESLDAEETALLRQAIRREKEAVAFIRHLLHEVFIPANNARLLESGDAQA